MKIAFRITAAVAGVTLVAGIVFRQSTIAPSNKTRVAQTSSTPQASDALFKLLIPGQGWQYVAQACTGAHALGAGPKGEVFFDDSLSQWIRVNPDDSKIGYKNSDAPAVKASLMEVGAIRSQAFGPDGRYYAIAYTDQTVRAYDTTGAKTTIAEGIPGQRIVVAHNGNIYVTQGASFVWLLKLNGEKHIVATGLNQVTSVALSPDQTQLYVADTGSDWVYRYQIQTDGSLQSRQQFAKLSKKAGEAVSAPRGICVDRTGRLFAANLVGLQVFDAAGQLKAIIPMPDGYTNIVAAESVREICFGGEKFDTLFITFIDKVYKRKLNTQGAQPWAEPIKITTAKL